MNRFKKFGLFVFCVSLATIGTAGTAMAQPSGGNADDGGEDTCAGVTDEQCSDAAKQAMCCARKQPRTAWHTGVSCLGTTESLPQKNGNKCACGNPEYIPVQTGLPVPSKPSYKDSKDENLTHRFYTVAYVCLDRDPAKRVMTQVDAMFAQFRTETRQGFMEAFDAADAAATKARDADEHAGNAQVRADEAWRKAVDNGRLLDNVVMPTLRNHEQRLNNVEHRVHHMAHWMVGGGWSVAVLPGGSVITGPTVTAGHRAATSDDNSVAIDVTGSLTASGGGMNKETYPGDESGSMAMGTLSVEASIATDSVSPDPARVRLGAMGVQTWRMNTPKDVPANHAIGVGPSVGLDFPIGPGGVLKPSVAVPYTFNGDHEGLGFVGQVTAGFEW